MPPACAFDLAPPWRVHDSFRRRKVVREQVIHVLHGWVDVDLHPVDLASEASGV
jgi:hypothetical protein